MVVMVINLPLHFSYPVYGEQTTLYTKGLQVQNIYQNNSKFYFTGSV